MRTDINPVVQYIKIRDVKDPERGNENDAGTDFYIPDYTQEFMAELMGCNSGNRIYASLTPNPKEEGNRHYITIPAHSKILIPSGIKVNILDKNTYLGGKNKSGIATKYCLVKTAEVVDADYRGEIFFALENYSDNSVTVWTGMKIIQLVQQEYIKTKWELITQDEWDALDETDRGEGSRGSTGV